MSFSCIIVLWVYCKIFLETIYEEMIYILRPRDSAIENVEKMIHCGDPAFGGAMYGCPTVENLNLSLSGATAVKALLNLS